MPDARTIDPADYTSTGDAAVRTGLSRLTIRRAAESGKLRAYRTPGGRMRVHCEDVETLLRPVEGGSK
ncbi:MAG: MerR family regulatory protein [Pseudonocardia sp.]|nr:MerR family regulatory protein [Pseudonocardia sp.]